MNGQNAGRLATDYRISSRPGGLITGAGRESCGALGSGHESPRHRRRRLHRRPPGGGAAGRRPARCGRSTAGRSRSGSSATTAPRTLVADLSLPEACRDAVDGVAEVYNLAADMGGMGFIEANKARLHALRADQHPDAGRRPRGRRRSASSSPPRPASTRQAQAGPPEVGAAARVRRLPGAARGRLRLGEAVRRADVPPLPRGLRPRRPGSPATTTSTGRTGPGRGGREKAPAAICRKVAEAALTGSGRDRDLGRRPPDPQLHLHRRLRRGDAADRRAATTPTRSTSAPRSW